MTGIYDVEHVVKMDAKLRAIREACNERREQIAADPRLAQKVPLISIQRIEDILDGAQ